MIGMIRPMTPRAIRSGLIFWADSLEEGHGFSFFLAHLFKIE